MKDSNDPRTKRSPNRDGKFVQAAMIVSAEPQRKMALARTFPLGSLTRIRATSGCITSWARYRIDPSQEYCLPTRWASSEMPKIETKLEV
jgi:hypothetical protein